RYGSARIVRRADHRLQPARAADPAARCEAAGLGLRMYPARVVPCAGPAVVRSTGAAHAAARTGLRLPRAAPAGRAVRRHVPWGPPGRSAANSEMLQGKG